MSDLPTDQSTRENLPPHSDPNALDQAFRASPAPAPAPAPAPHHPDRIGAYHILEAIGEGGMGLVYKAEQRHPIKRLVALKLIKLGMDSNQIIARFESERQALALMTHPNVAGVLDAGATESGRPYFVMEYVAGQSITSFCDTHRYTIKERLELFAQACAAIQHAHQKAIIHRDLKPSNILVMLQDGKPIVKVIDFGLAKAMAQTLTDRTLLTEAGQLVGTREYMSPEQADFDAHDIDTRTDIYSLGVVLYELLAGTLPFDQLRTSSFAESQRIIREQAPPRPSTRLSGIGAANASQIATNRRTEPDSLARQLKRELEWIPLKAIRKERAERYSSVAELAQDIENYLNDRPLLAAPESAGYRLRKFLRRHSRAVVAVLAIVVSLLAGVIVSSVLLIRLKHEANKTTIALNDAQSANADAQAVIKFLTEDMVGSASPETTLGQEVTVTQALDNAAKSSPEKFKSRPLVQAAVLDAIANTYTATGRADRGLPHAMQALATRRKLLGDDHPDTLQSVSTVGYLLQVMGKLSEAEPYSHDALQRRRRVLGHDHPSTIESMNYMAGLLLEQGKFAEAEAMYREALDRRRRVLGSDHAETIISINNMGYALARQDKLAEAEPFFREALEVGRRVAGDDHPSTLGSMNNMGALLQAQGKLLEAEPFFREALERSRRVLGDDEPKTLAAISNMGQSLRAQGKLAEAEPFFREALERRQRVSGGEHPDTLLAMANLGVLLQAREQLADADKLYSEALTLRRKVLPAGHPDIAQNLQLLASVRTAQKNYAEAEPLYREALDIRRQAFGPRAAPTTQTATSLAKVLVALNRDDDAAVLRREYDLAATTQESSR